MKIFCVVGIGILNACAAFNVRAESNILNFELYRLRAVGKSSCSKILSPRSATIIPFDKYAIQYETYSDFILGMNTPSDHFDYLYASPTAPLSKYDPGGWSKEPDVRSQQLFVLKTSKLKSEKSSWTVQELRSQVRLLTYTKVPVSQYFRIFGILIEHVRALESFSNSVVYETAHLDTKAVFSSRSVKHQLLNFVGSWKTVNKQEAAIKYFVEDFLTNRYRHPEEVSDLADFLPRLESELLKYYADARVNSVIDSLR